MDNIRSIHDSGGVYRYVSLLVSDLQCLAEISWVLQGKEFTVLCFSKYFSTLLCFCRCRLPFYYELKIAFVVWLLSPYTKGSSVLYRKFVHPTLSSKEKVKSFFLCGIFLCFLWCTQGKVFSQGFRLISMFLCLMCAMIYTEQTKVSLLSTF